MIMRKEQQHTMRMTIKNPSKQKRKKAKPFFGACYFIVKIEELQNK